MLENSSSNGPGRAPDDASSPARLTATLWAGRWTIVSLTVLVTLVAGVAALVLPRQYQATVTLSPVSNSSSGGQLGALGSLASQFGGLASLAGIAVSGDVRKSESLAVLQSEALTESYIRENDLLPVLYAKQWDPVGKRWKPGEPEKLPTLWKANQDFKNIRSLTTDAKTNLSALTITWRNPELAAKWANDLVRKTNDYLRDQAIAETERNIAYLTEQASKTDAVGARQAIYAIMQSEINKAMLARGNSEYALKVLDPAFAPEIASFPKLLLMLPGGFLLGLILSALVVTILNEWHKGNPER